MVAVAAPLPLLMLGDVVALRRVGIGGCKYRWLSGRWLLGRWHLMGGGRAEDGGVDNRECDREPIMTTRI